MSRPYTTPSLVGEGLSSLFAEGSSYGDEQEPRVGQIVLRGPGQIPLRFTSTGSNPWPVP
jgi:hypothetical protein